MNKENIFIASQILVNNKWLTHSAIITSNGMIENIVSQKTMTTQQKRKAVSAHYIVPAFIDIQIYGAYEQLFVNEPSEKSLEKIVEYSKKGGAHFCIPTIPTINTNTIYKCIDVVKKFIKKNPASGVLGLHIEGPWINELKKGAHIIEAINKPKLFDVIKLLEHGKDVIKIITLAPEICHPTILEKIKQYNIIISAGHSNATFKEATDAFNNSVTMTTHLFNAMSQINSREPGLVGATMQHSKAMASIIPDGFHVHYENIKLAKQLMKDRLFVITDAVTNCNKGYYQHKLDGNKYKANGTLSGSALTMLQAVKNLVSYCNIPFVEAINMASLYPAKLLGMDNTTGKIKKGYTASFNLLDEELNIIH